MSLQQLDIINFRNLQSAKLIPSEQFNLLIGANGSGKTSILEAIFLLCVGRSFRTHLIRRVINYESDSLSVFGMIVANDKQAIPVGIEKTTIGDTKIKISGKYIESLAELAIVLPGQLINSNSFQLLAAGPKYRRQYLDWGLFHVEPNFYPVWKQYQNALKQRNAALKKRCDAYEIKTWDKLLLPLAVKIDLFRKEYLGKIEQFIFKMFQQLLPIENLAIKYYSGWPEGEELDVCLANGLPRDFEQGHTQYGPHRADMVIKIKNIPAHDVLSRGQQKLMVTSLCLAQGLVLRFLSNKKCIYLIDDLPSELDQQSLKKILNILTDLKAQIFLTSVDLAGLQDVASLDESRVFHVEHGKVVGREDPLN